MELLFGSLQRHPLLFFDGSIRTADPAPPRRPPIQSPLRHHGRFPVAEEKGKEAPHKEGEGEGKEAEGWDVSGIDRAGSSNSIDSNGGDDRAGDGDAAGDRAGTGAKEGFGIDAEEKGHG